MSVADAGERQLRDQRDADAGRDQALDGQVVVALEGDPRLEAGGVAGADHVAGAGARRPRSGSRTPRAGPRAAAACASASGWPAGSARCERVLEAARSGGGPRSSRSPTPSNSNSRTRSNSPARRRGAISSGSPSARVTSTPGCEARKAAIACGISVAPGGREGGDAQAAAAAARRSPRARPRRLPSGRGCRRRARPARRPAAVGRTPPRSRSISGAPTSPSSVAIACETADCV